MAEPTLAPRPADVLHGRRLLVVEDDYWLASDLARTLEEHGAEIVGPAGSVGDALALVEARGDGLDAAVLDVNLGAERSYPVADALATRGVPFVFATGYDSWIIPDAYADAPRCEKPLALRDLARALARVLPERPA